MCFSPYLGMGCEGGGSPKGLIHNMLMQFFTLGSSKIEVSELYFFDIVTTQNDHATYVKHVSGRISLPLPLAPPPNNRPHDTSQLTAGNRIIRR